MSFVRFWASFDPRNSAASRYVGMRPITSRYTRRTKTSSDAGGLGFRLCLAQSAASRASICCEAEALTWDSTAGIARVAPRMRTARMRELIFTEMAAVDLSVRWPFIQGQIGLQDPV